MFRYRLEALLRYRKTLEDDRKRAFAEANRHYQAEISEMRRLEQERRDVMEMTEKKMSIGVDRNTMELYDMYMAGAAVNIADAAKRVEGAGQIAEMEREKLVEAMKKRRIMEHHRETLKERHNAEEDRKERLFADEVALLRFSRKEAN
ncbi:MAG: flagellar export protein FliJ [Nitrospinae bacterium]|nr:flagellar export protein FliJ [Nitrospinota bacterium]